MDLSQAGHLLQLTPQGVYCPAGDFHIDPWMPVPRAVVTHAHSDHARAGCGSYLCLERGKEVLAQRVHSGALIESLRPGQVLLQGLAQVSLHPAGHILGSAQVRIEVSGEVWVVTGDYKTTPDPTCDPFEPITCHTLITESTFGLPIFHWRPESEIVAEILDWWRANADAGITSVLLTYALGKAQRILAGLRGDLPGPLAVHGAIQRFLPIYERAGVELPATIRASPENQALLRGKGLLLAPPSVHGSTYLRRYQPVSIAMASGWMAIRGMRRRRALDRGFVLSDHADWRGLLETVRHTGAQNVGVTHGYIEPLTRYLNETGKAEAFSVPTRFRGEALVPDSDDDESDPSDLPLDPITPSIEPQIP